MQVSPEFHDQLSSILYGQECRKFMPNLQDDDPVRLEVISNMAKYLFLMDTFLRFSLLICHFSDPFPVQLILIHDMASIS
jgi:hypothetical protein